MENIYIEAIKINYEAIVNNQELILGLKATAATKDQNLPIGIGFIPKSKITNFSSNINQYTKAEIEIAVTFDTSCSIDLAISKLEEQKLPLYLAIEFLNGINAKDYAETLQKNAGFACCMLTDFKININQIMDYNFYFENQFGEKLSDEGNICKLKSDCPYSVAKEMLNVLKLVDPNFRIPAKFTLITGSLIKPISNLEDKIKLVSYKKTVCDFVISL